LALVAITRLRLRGYRFLPLFMWHSLMSSHQAERSPGFLTGALSADPLRLVYWTLTMWKDAGAMRAFRGSGAHQRIMPWLADWCDEAAVVHWEQADDVLPPADEVLRRMASGGRVLRLNHPSPDHAAGRIAADGRPPRRGAKLYTGGPYARRDKGQEKKGK
jgi:hypothetical protein